MLSVGLRQSSIQPLWAFRKAERTSALVDSFVLLQSSSDEPICGSARSAGPNGKSSAPKKDSGMTGGTQRSLSAPVTSWRRQARRTPRVCSHHTWTLTVPDGSDRVEPLKGPRTGRKQTREAFRSSSEASGSSLGHGRGGGAAHAVPRWYRQRPL